jgi:hypothetical protein
MTQYQKAFLLRLIDKQIDKLMDHVTGILPEQDRSDCEAWNTFWKANEKQFDWYSKLYAARGQIQVTETEQ